MALWGSRDSFELTGTVTVTNTANATIVTGSGTAFDTELELGDVIIISDVKSKVTGITSNTVITIDPAWTAANVAGGTATGQDAPKYLAARDRSVHGIDKVFGVDQTEALVNGQDPGWVRVIQYTDVHGNLRDKRSVLVAMKSITADAADDAVYPDAIVTIVTQPEDSSEDTGNTVTFTVVTSVVPAGTTINHRWQEAANANVAFVNLTDTGVYSNTATPTLEIADNTGLDGYIYRVQLSANGVSANTVSANATIEEL
jgi:hypothetical protein